MFIDGILLLSNPNKYEKRTHFNYYLNIQDNIVIGGGGGGGGISRLGRI